VGGWGAGMREGGKPEGLGTNNGGGTADLCGADSNRQKGVLLAHEMFTQVSTIDPEERRGDVPHCRKTDVSSATAVPHCRKTPVTAVALLLQQFPQGAMGGTIGRHGWAGPMGEYGE
jgi:hypothetical protein